MANKLFERPTVTQELIDYYVSEGRRMQSEAIHDLVNHCYSVSCSKVRQVGHWFGRRASSLAAKLKDRHPFHPTSHAK